MDNQIVVHEPRDKTARLVLSISIAVAGILSLYGGILFMYWSFENNLPYGLGVVIFLLMLFIPMFSLMFLSTWGKKTFATPIIAAGEKPNPSAPFITFGLAGVAVGEVVGRQKFVICEEGIAVGYIFGFLLTRWNRIKSFTPKRNRQQFVLKLGSVGRQIIYCQNTFDQVQLLLTQHVPVST